MDNKSNTWRIVDLKNNWVIPNNVIVREFATKQEAEQYINNQQGEVHGVD
tara:strand:- start:256 stop:405 length:150 start_codon:yes stop_codon:yes gene_type:complete